jgi:hypothetical protein
MSLKLWLLLGALVFAVFGIALAAVPQWMGDTFGLDLNESGRLITRLFGAAFIFAAIASFYARGSSSSESAVRGVVLASVVANIIGFAFALMATLGGVFNALGWIPTVLYGLFALVFLYFYFTKPS